jgi:hypothetical protein
MIASLFYSIAFFLQAVFTPGLNRVDGKHIKKMPAKITKIAAMDTLINESSALIKPSNLFDFYFTLNDSGGKPEVFSINDKGELLATMPIPNAKNVDWEELTYYNDSLLNPHIVIGDIGNNNNQRRNLCLYDYDIEHKSTSKHAFSYADQDAFPPQKDSMNYDCEAFFKRDSSYYLISKNRGNNSVKIYRLGESLTSTSATIHQRIQIKGMTTACSVWKDEKTGAEKLAVLFYGRIVLFNIVDTEKGIELKAYGVIRFARGGQTEGICWYNKNELRVTNEKGKLFKVVFR